MTATQDAYAGGYKDAIEDISSAWENMGRLAAVQWIQDNGRSFASLRAVRLRAQEAALVTLSREDFTFLKELAHWYLSDAPGGPSNKRDSDRLDKISSAVRVADTLTTPPLS